MIRSALLVAFVMCAFAGMSCGSRSENGQSGGRLNVFVTILPQAYFVEQVGGDRVSVKVLVGPGQNPHTFEPTPRQIAALSSADVYFTIGVPFERQLLQKIKASFPNLNIADTTEGVKFRRLTAEEAGSDTDEEHHAGDPDPHTWLDPKLAKIEAGNICAGLIRIDPQHKTEYEANLRAFQGKLDELDARLAAALAPLKGRDFFTYHPAFGYFGDAYGLRQAPVEMEGKEPSIKQLDDLIERARKTGVRVIFVQPQFSSKNAEAVAKAIGGVVVPMDDLARDYMRNLEEMAAAVARALNAKGEAERR